MRRSIVPQSEFLATGEFPDLWGLTANEVANRKSSAFLSLQEYHMDQEENVENEVRSIDNVAFYPLHLLMNNLTPFNYTVVADSATPKSFLPVIQNSIKLYQLYIFYVYAVSELGSVHGESILALQNKHLNKILGSKQEDTLAVRFDDITNAAKQHAKRHASTSGNLSLEIPVENTIARSFLLSNKESPLYVDPKKRDASNETNFRGIDLALAEHLGLSKDEALKVYSRYFSIVIVKV